MIKEYIAEIGLDLVKDRIKDDQEVKIIRGRLIDYMDRQSKYNFQCTREEEIDFEGLAIYLQNDLISDVQVRVFGTKRERGRARADIISKAVTYSQAHTSLSRQRAIKMTETAIDILHGFYKSKVNRELKFIAAQIEDTIIDVTSEQHKEQTQQFSHVVSESEKHILESFSSQLENTTMLSLDRNVQLMKTGDISQVESNIAGWFNSIASQHILFPDYCYEYKGESHQLYSKPVSVNALKKYPPKISCTGTIQMDGKYLHVFDANTIEYANRHQLLITLNVETAKKFLGDVDDPIQHEAESLVGETFTIPPKPFPPAFPCSISISGKVFFDYILFRTEEILDDDTIIITNREQTNCVFRIRMTANLHTNKTTYSISTEGANNEELLQYLVFLQSAASGSEISIKVLSTGDILAKGILGTLEYRSGFDDIEAEISFLEKVVSVERYFGQPLVIPEEIIESDYNTLSYLANLINGKKCTGSWTKLEFDVPLTVELREKIKETERMKFSLSYIGSISANLYGNEYNVQAIKQFESVVYQDVEKLKKKAEVLDVGDSIKIAFLPGEGDSGIWKDSLYIEDYNN